MVIIHPTHSFSQAKPHSDEQLEIPFVFDSNSPDALHTRRRFPGHINLQRRA